MILKFDECVQIKMKQVIKMSSEREQCGLLFGEEDEMVSIKSLILVKNSSRSLNSFAISNKDFMQAILANNHKHLGVFHTHFEKSELSKSDRMGIIKSKKIWVISCKNSDEQISAYRYNISSKTIDKLKIES